MKGANSSCQLSEGQKAELLQLLSPDNPDLLFDNVNYMLGTTIQALKGTQKNLITEQVKQLSAIAKTARKLRTQLNQLDPFFLDLLDAKIGMALNNCQSNDSGKATITIGLMGVAQTTTYPLSLRKVASTLEEESEFEAEALDRDYGSSSVEWVLEGLYTAWGNCNLGSISASANSTFVRYVGIVLEDDELEKLAKQIQRSKWFAAYKEYSRDKNKKK